MTTHRTPRRAATATGATAAVLVALCAAPATAAPTSASSQAATTRYRYVEIAPLGESTFGAYDVARAVNTAGKVVGISSYPRGNHPFAWQAGRTTDLGDLTDAFYSEAGANAVNDRGVVVGQTQVAGPGNEGPHAFVLRNGVMTDLGTAYPTGGGSSARGVNDDGLVVGDHWASQATPRRAVVWRGGVLRELPDLGGDSGAYGLASSANAVNDAGQVVGVAFPKDRTQAQHGVLWQDGRLRDLGNLGGTADDTTANDINDLGTVVGRSDNGRELHAFRWRAGRMTDLGALGPDFPRRISEAYGINASGTVVGYTTTQDSAAGGLVATVWRGAGPQALSTLVDGIPRGTHLTVAYDVSDSGVVVGQSCRTVSAGCAGPTAFVLVPTT